MRAGILLICFLICAQSLSAQITAKDRIYLREMQDSLQALNYKIINDSIEPQRYNANYSFIKTLVAALKVPYSYHFEFDSIKAISILKSPDNKFRLFSWPVMNNDGSYRYYGSIQINQPDGKLKLFPLVDYSPAIKNPADTVTNNEAWYGAQYYKIIPITSKASEPYYTLLGWKGNTINSTKKVIEVLSLKDEKPKFGLAVFDADPSNPGKKRIIFEYDRRASMLLKYDASENLIVFDHLAPPDEKMKGLFQFYGPDLSYDGYKLKNGRWVYLPDLELKNDPTEQDDNFNDPVKLRKN